MDRMYCRGFPSTMFRVALLLLVARYAAAAAAQELQNTPPGEATSDTTQFASVPGAYYGNKEPTIWKKPALLLIGDSLTELGLDPAGGWSVRLAHAYARKADVINRGFGGYTTPTILLSLPEILESVRGQTITLATVWLGANDASKPDSGNSAANVPIEDYAVNLVNITQMLKAAGVQHVVLVTPPPVNERAPQAIPPGETKPPRTFRYTSRYAATVRSVAAAMSIPVLDVWSMFEVRDDWSTELLVSDGLHLSPKGQEVVFNGLLELIGRQLPDIQPKALPWHHPTWWFINYANATKQFGAEEAAYNEAFNNNAATKPPQP